MIDDREFDRLSSKVRAVQSGRLLVSDRVSDHVDDLWLLIESVPWRPSDWQHAVTIAPQEAREWSDRITELQYLLGQIADDQRGAPVFDAGMPLDISQEVAT